MDGFFLMLPPIIGLVSYVIIQVLVFRTERVRLLVSAVFGIVCGGGVSMFAHVQMIGALPVGLNQTLFLAANMMIYAGFAYTYCHVLSMGETARRVRILIELTEAGAEGVTEQNICQNYGAQEMVERRLERLLVNEQIEERDGKLYVRNGIVIWITKAIWVLKGILALKDIEDNMRETK